MRILLCPDSFKGSLSAADVCKHSAEGILKICKNAEIFSLPLADGGEGTLSIFAKLFAIKPISVSVENAYGEPRTARYLFFENEKTALIESAESIGLVGLDKNCLNTKITSSKGVGQLITDAVLRLGAKKILITLGGTATTDGGMGALSQMGLEFLDAKGQKLFPIGENMEKVKTIDKTEKFSAFEHLTFYFGADVKSPFYDKDGAAFVFAPQKGATQKDILLLDRGLKNLASLYASVFGRNVQSFAGSGAAGGLLGGLYAAFGGQIVDCFSLLAKLYNIEKLLDSADYIVTGEGKTDSQTKLHKLPMRVARLAQQKNVPCILLSGAIEKDFDAKALGFYKAVALKNGSMSTEYCMEHAKELLKTTVQTLFRKEFENGKRAETAN